MRKSTALMTLAALAFYAAGCSPYHKEPEFQESLGYYGSVRPERYAGPDQWPPYAALYTQRFAWKMQYVAEQLYSKSKTWAPERKTVLMTTIVPVENLRQPTNFGRLVSEQLMTELARKGFRVVETRKMKGYLVRDGEGEFYLSRDIKDIAKEHGADAALVGTFSKNGDQALINVRLVDTQDAHVIAASSAMMDLRGDMFLGAMMDDEKTPSQENGPREINVRKRVMPGVDPYAETLNDMVHGLAYRLSDAAKPGVIAVTTFVDVDNMYRAATFGRYMTEELIGELKGMGYDVLELRASPDVFIDLRIGELGLTREMSQLLNARKADALVVGTYAKAGDNVVVNARMIDSKTKLVVGAGEMLVDAKESNKFVTALLENEVTTVMPTETVEGY